MSTDNPQPHHADQLLPGNRPAFQLTCRVDRVGDLVETVLEQVPKGVAPSSRPIGDRACAAPLDVGTRRDRERGSEAA